MLKKLETSAFLLAALLATTIEGAFVYWIWYHPLPGQVSDSYIAHWMSPTLPQSWLIGALLALFYYVIPITHPAVRLDSEERTKFRRTFLRTWYWFVAFASAQGCVLYLTYFGMRRP